MEKKENVSKEHRSPTLPVNIYFINFIFIELFKYIFDKWYVCCFFIFFCTEHDYQQLFSKSINIQRAVFF